ncbi:MAG: response regulator, partial [Thermoanaerobaculia bacterium]|nr:response regulator [Thermoanaerobaculia bacterium]
MSETVLIVDDDVDVGLALAAGLEREGRDIVLCRDAESAELVISARDIAFIVADVRLSGPFRYDGLELLEYARRHVPGARVIAISGSGAAGLDRAVQERGATFLEKPFEIETLELLVTPRNGSRSEPSLTIVPTLDEILSGSAIVPAFQPIVSLG